MYAFRVFNADKLVDEHNVICPPLLLQMFHVKIFYMAVLLQQL
jgi:hypothetical protein